MSNHLHFIVSASKRYTKMDLTTWIFQVVADIPLQRIRNTIDSLHAKGGSYLFHEVDRWSTDHLLFHCYVCISDNLFSLMTDHHHHQHRTAVNVPFTFRLLTFPKRDDVCVSRPFGLMRVRNLEVMKYRNFFLIRYNWKLVY